MSAILSRA